ncbi:MAG: helix-turn-helix domain-containing protein [Opitutaceae bacterium]|jgi:transcriptional regulator with XRE-family HTH domain|nr:helix-turn-helix domain-containing protein [Opitutaceae bacterium]
MQSIGERLEEARKRKGITIREAAEAIKIRSEYLHKFEGNQYDIRLPEIYVRGFLRSYANYLRLPADKIINDYNALGLAAAGKSRPPLSREVYGRMDISTSVAPKETPSSAPAQTAQQSAAASAEGPAPGGASPDEPPPSMPRNPATFVPYSSGGLPIDKKLLIKAGAIAAGTLVIIIVLLWAIFSGRGAKTDPATAQTAVPSEVWLRPQAGEPVLALVSKNGPVLVKASMASGGAILYQGTIPAGESRVIPRRGALRIEAEPFQNLDMEIGGTRYSMPEPRRADGTPDTVSLRSAADVAAP